MKIKWKIDILGLRIQFEDLIVSVLRAVLSKYLNFEVTMEGQRIFRKNGETLKEMLY
ncbi:hypothetical protein [Thermodesulfovibrio sp. TK110]